MLYNVVNFVLITVGIIIIIRCDRYREDFVERKFLAARFCLERFGTKSRLKIKRRKEKILIRLFRFIKNCSCKEMIVSNVMTMMA